MCRYTSAVSQLKRAITNVKHVLQPAAAAENRPPSPSVKTWNHEEEQNFVLKPRQVVSESDGQRRGSSWSWFVA